MFIFCYLYCRVIGVLVADEEGSLGRAPVGIDLLVVHDALVDLHVPLGDGPVERKHHHLRGLAKLGIVSCA